MEIQLWPLRHGRCPIISKHSAVLTKSLNSTDNNNKKFSMRNRGKKSEFIRCFVKLFWLHSSGVLFQSIIYFCVVSQPSLFQVYQNFCLGPSQNGTFVCIKRFNCTQYCNFFFFVKVLKFMFNFNF